MSESTVYFADSRDPVEARNVHFKKGGWISVVTDDAFTRYPPRHIDRVVTERE